MDQGQSAQVTADKLGILRRELHIFFFNVFEGGDPKQEELVEKAKLIGGYDAEDWGFDNDGPPLPEEWGPDERNREAYWTGLDHKLWYDNIRAEILNYKLTMYIHKLDLIILKDLIALGFEDLTQDMVTSPYPYTVNQLKSLMRRIDPSIPLDGEDYEEMPIGSQQWWNELAKQYNVTTQTLVEEQAKLFGNL